MLQAVHRTRLCNRRGAVVEPRRARLADRVATLVELRRQRRLGPRRLYLLPDGVMRRLIVRDEISRLICASGGEEDGLEHSGAFRSSTSPEPDAPTSGIVLGRSLRPLVTAVHYRYRCGAFCALIPSCLAECSALQPQPLLAGHAFRASSCLMITSCTIGCRSCSCAAQPNATSRTPMTSGIV